MLTRRRFVQILGAAAAAVGVVAKVEASSPETVIPPVPPPPPAPPPAPVLDASRSTTVIMTNRHTVPIGLGDLVGTDTTRRECWTFETGSLPGGCIGIAMKPIAPGKTGPVLISGITTTRVEFSFGGEPSPAYQRRMNEKLERLDRMQGMTDLMRGAR